MIIRQTKHPVLTQWFARRLAEMVRDASPDLFVAADWSVQLLAGNIPELTPAITYATLEPLVAEFSGADDVVPVWGAAGNLGADTDGISAQTLFNAAADTPFISATVTGYMVYHGVFPAYNLIMAEKWVGAEQVPMVEAGDSLLLVVSIPIFQRPVF